jgi:hypothetical protein
MSSEPRSQGKRVRGSDTVRGRIEDDSADGDGSAAAEPLIATSSGAPVGAPGSASAAAAAAAAEPLIAASSGAPVGAPGSAAAAAMSADGAASPRPPPILPEALRQAKAARDAAPPVVAAPNLAVGITARDELIKTLLRIFAKSDFKHDFGEKVESRDWITSADRTRFLEMVQKLPVKQRVEMINKFDKMFQKGAGTNLLQLLHPGIAKQLYPDPDGALPKAEFITEEEVLGKIGFNYTAVKAEISQWLGRKEITAFKKENTTIATQNFNRSYRITAQKYKNENGTTRNLASLFKDVTGATKFAILVDASLGMSVSAIGDSSLKPDPGVPCEFAVLQNVESDGDSATGVTDFKMVVGANATKVKIMRDIGTSTVVYPIWNNPNDKRSDAEVLFSKIQIILNRVEAGEVEASIILGNESHTIPDLATTSNVKNASLNGLAAWFAKEILKEADRKPADERKPYIYALVKRMGDWCQALSLLDRTRLYTPLDPKTKQPIPGAKPATLQDLIAQGYEVGLVTNDRILLAYGLVLGVNVYFTTASDLNCLMYFRNKDDIADEGTLAKNAEANYDAFQQIFDGVTGRSPTELSSRVDELVTAAKDAYSAVIPTGPAYDSLRTELDAALRKTFTENGVKSGPILSGLVDAFRAKVILSNAGEFRTNFDEIANEMKKNIDIYNSKSVSLKEKYGATLSLVNLANKLRTDVAHNAFTMGRLKKGEFSGRIGSGEGSFKTQLNVFVDLAKKFDAGGRIGNSESVTRAKEILLSIRDDVKQVLQKNIMPAASIIGYIPPIPTEVDRPGRPNDKDISNFQALYGAFTTVRAEIPVSATNRQVGGGIDALFFNAVLQREVFPYKSKKLETTVNALTTRTQAGDASATATLELLDALPAAQVETYYRDDKSRPYSVIDRYLITKEDAQFLYRILDGIIADTFPLKPKDLSTCGEETMRAQFAIFRSALLYHDMLYERAEHILDEVLAPESASASASAAAAAAAAPGGVGDERMGAAAADMDAAAADADGAAAAANIENGKVEIEDAEATHGAQLEFQKIQREAALLRMLVNQYIDEKEEKRLRPLLKKMVELFRTGSVNLYIAPVFAKQTADLNLRNVRSAIFASYKPYNPITIVNPTSDKNIRVEEIEAKIDDVAPAAAPAAPSIGQGIADAFSAPKFQFGAPPAAPGSNLFQFGAPSVPASGSNLFQFGPPAVAANVGPGMGAVPRPPPPPLSEADRRALEENDLDLGGGSRLESMGGSTSNAGGSSSRVPPGGRRGLYARLR